MSKPREYGWVSARLAEKDIQRLRRLVDHLELSVSDVLRIAVRKLAEAEGLE